LTAALVALGRRIGLPSRLDGLNLSAAALDRVACAAAEDAANRTNPRLAVAADYRRMLEAAL
jgi:alcohol dehydrogenase class IV